MRGTCRLAAEPIPDELYRNTPADMLQSWLPPPPADVGRGALPWFTETVGRDDDAIVLHPLQTTLDATPYHPDGLFAFLQGGACTPCASWGRGVAMTRRWMRCGGWRGVSALTPARYSCSG